MNDQSSSQATNVNPTAEQQSDNEESWSEEKLPFVEDCTPKGFLQLCADRRFHSLIQNEFQKDAGLKDSTDYWIHADAGGTPKMEKLTTAPIYCYEKKGVRLMGWSAHGAGCGGFGEEVEDDVIRKALQKTFRKQRRNYPEASHFCYFVTIKKETKETVMYSMRFIKR